jgi:subfamily B ATP-binding cassette protein MsbA
VSTKLGKAFDMRIFVRLMSFAKNYRLKFGIAIFSTILLSIVAAIDPYILIYTIDNFTKTKDLSQLLDNTIILIIVLLIQVLLHFSFIYYANW